MKVDPFNDPDGRGKHPGDPDPIEHMVANFEATIEGKDAEIARLRKALKSCVSWMPNCSARIEASAVLDTQQRKPSG